MHKNLDIINIRVYLCTILIIKKNKQMKELKPIDFIITSKFDDNIERYGYNDNTCQCCGKPIKNIQFAVFTVEGPDVVLADVTDEDLAEQGLYSQGLYNIGPECIKKYPKEYRVKL